MNQNYAVFGLGRYGTSVAKELVKNGAEVLAVDIDEMRVNAAISEIPFCKSCDVTNIEVLKQLGISSIDTVIIAIAGSLESSVMAVMLCKELGVKTVIVKCANEMHRKIFTKVGADKVVFPESESGFRLAKNLLSSGFVDVIELSEDVSLIELDIKEEWIGKTLMELSLRKRYGINAVALRDGDSLQINIDPAMKLDGAMKLIVIANKSKLGKLK
jgi:trk system potassium uptake protein TrkA